jgi:2-haloacid dehalogenase/putative hydrolase of the HAD superfamily
MVKAVFLDFYGTLVEEDDKIVSSIVENVVNNSKNNKINHNNVGQFWCKEFTSLCHIHNGNNFKLQKEIEYITLTNTIKEFESEKANRHITLDCNYSANLRFD